MAWDVWDPFEDMKRLNKEMERTFRDFFRKPVRFEKGKLVREPLADVSETKNEVIAKIELPGVEKKDVDLKITKNMLAVKAEKKEEKEEKQKGFYRHERSYQGFQKAFSLPARVIPEKAVAKLDKGVLEVRIPKSKQLKQEKLKVKKIEVK